MFKLFRKKKLQYLKRKCFHYSRKVPPSCSCCSNWSIFLLAMLFHSSSSATCGASSRLGLVSPSQITIIDFHDFRPDSQAIARQQSSSEHALHLMPSVINGGDIGPCHVHCSVQWWGQPDGLFGDDEYLSRIGMCMSGESEGNDLTNHIYEQPLCSPPSGWRGNCPRARPTRLGRGEIRPGGDFVEKCLLVRGWQKAGCVNRCLIFVKY